MRLKPNTLIVVAGPTASGKTALAIQIAKAVDGEIVSADSMQIYRGVDIATAKPTPEELAAVPHHLIGFLPMDRAFSVADYAELARKEINDILSRGKVPVLCGGTGLYIKAIVDNVQYSEAITGDEALRERLRQLAEREGNDALWRRLEAMAPETAKRIHPNNIGRVIRAIEVMTVSGKSIREHEAESLREPCPYHVIELGLRYRGRETLYGRINRRVDKMVEKVAKLVSQATDLPAISAASRQGSACVKRFDLILAGQGSFILVLMLGGEQVVNKLIKLPVNVSETDLKLLSAVLNASMTDIPLEDFTAELMEKVMRSAGAAASLVPVILDFTQETLKNSDSTRVAVTGQARLLSLPEYRDVDKAQRVMDSIDEEALANLPAVMEGANGTKVLVGPENVADELKDTSVVMTKFDIGDGMQGMIGVVGPTRMDYAKVTARLSYFAESLSKMFGKPEQPQQPKLPEPPKEG